MSEAYEGDECLRRQVLDHLGAEDAAERAVGQRFQVARASAWSATRPAARQCATIPASRSTPRARFPPSRIARGTPLGRTRHVQHGRGVGKEVEVIRWRCRMSSRVPRCRSSKRTYEAAGKCPVRGHGGYRDRAPSLARERASARPRTQDLDPIRERSEPIHQVSLAALPLPCSAARRSWRLSDWSSSRWLSAPSPPYLVPHWKDEAFRSWSNVPLNST